MAQEIHDNPVRVAGAIVRLKSGELVTFQLVETQMILRDILERIEKLENKSEPKKLEEKPMEKPVGRRRY